MAPPEPGSSVPMKSLNLSPIITSAARFGANNLRTPNSATTGSRPGTPNNLGPASPAPSAPRSPSLYAPTVVSRAQLRKRFCNFDDEEVYRDVVERRGLDPNAKNFVVQFGAERAMVACDLEMEEMELLLRTKDLDFGYDMPVRWINVWNPSEQRTTVEAIGQHYGFSSRLTLSIWAWDRVKSELRELQKKKKEAAARAAAQRHHLSGRRPHDPPPQDPPAQDPPSQPRVVGPTLAFNDAMMSPPEDLERGINGTHSTSASIGDKSPSVALSHRLSHTTSEEKDLLRDKSNIATFMMMQTTIDYTSIDQENHFLCIGANWLHRRPEAKKTAKRKAGASLVPPKHWSWFALCDDYNVLSFHEAPHYSSVPKDENKDEWRAEELKNMRSNSLKVLRQLSLCGLEADKNKIMQLTSVRQPLLNINAGRTIPPNQHGLEGSSNLFYYLFEDYAAAFDVLNHSKAALESIGTRVLRTADWRYKEDTSDVIPTLYKLNKELRQLRHLFTNYKILIERLLKKDYLDGGIFAAGGATGDPTKDLLSGKACNRFKRLQVQLQSLMLDTITDYLDEKESLQNTYFNLTNQKDSQATERLTRSATLLAKLSVFFLPITFMTSYFSVQIPDMTNGYTAWTYWGAFAVIAGCSFVSLFFFSRVLMFVSERLDHISDKGTRWIAHRTGLGRRQRPPETEGDDDL